MYALSDYVLSNNCDFKSGYMYRIVVFVTLICPIAINVDNEVTRMKDILLFMVWRV
jgi:hypothetical protein